MAQRSKEETDRLDRLSNEAKGGGGLPLPLVFGALLEEMADNGGITHERAEQIISKEFEFKRSGVMRIWTSWEKLTADLMAQMESSGVVQRTNGTWTIGPKFKTGEYLTIIPKRKNGPSDGVTIYPAEEREERSRESRIEREISSLIGHGLRPVDQKRAAEIRNSVPKVGQLYPVLVDKTTGRILDGRHRYEADPNWEQFEVPIDSEEHALAVALWANHQEKLPAKIVTRIMQLLGDVEGSRERKRERIKAALLENHKRPNREIGRELGVDHKTVAAARVELEGTGEIPQWQAPKTPGSGSKKRGTDPAPKPKTGIGSDPELVAMLQQMSWVDGMSQTEIGQELRIPPRTVADFVGKKAVPITDELATAKRLKWPPAPPPKPKTPEPTHEHRYSLCCEICSEWKDSD